MYIKKVFRAMVTAVIMLAVSVSAQAQKPSAAAIAADPEASNNTVENGYTLSPAQIRAAYEKLPDDTYLKPYYHPDLEFNYYRGKKYDVTLEDHIYTLFKGLPSPEDWDGLDGARNGYLFLYEFLRGHNFYYVQFFNDVIPAGNQKVYPEAVVERKGVMPQGTKAIFANLSIFAADPKGFFPFEKFCQAVVGFAVISRVGWDALGRTPDETTIDGTQIKLSVPWEKVKKNMEKEVKRLHDVAFKETPLEVVKSGASRYFMNVNTLYKAEKYQAAIFYFYHLEVALYFWKNHKNFKKDEDFDYLYGGYKHYLTQLDTWKEKVRLSSEAGEMPKTYDLGADLAQKALAAAKKNFSFNVDKVVFTSDEWHDIKDDKYPYRRLQRHTGCALLSKDGDKWLIRYYAFIQRCDGNGNLTDNFGFAAGTTSSHEARPVNYKP